MEDQKIPDAIDRHWAASATGDLEKEHDIYHDDAMCDYFADPFEAHAWRA
jgi:hypothetical protein